MKLADINIIGGILSGIKINRISDSNAREVLMDDFLAIRRALRPYQKDSEEIIEKFRSDWKDEITDILAKRGGSHDAYHAAERQLNDTLRKLLEEGEVEVPLAPVKSDILYAPGIWGSDVTVGDIDDSVKFLVGHGIAEE